MAYRNCSCPPQTNRVLPQLDARFAQPKWYEIGWGDKGFYQAQEITKSPHCRRCSGLLAQ
ncbi:DUF2459 domain-containing protein [Escherichia coli]|nr:DUF2459 domain-containing protein [Escherichia coli]